MDKWLREYFLNSEVSPMLRRMDIDEQFEQAVKEKERIKNQLRTIVNSEGKILLDEYDEAQIELELREIQYYYIEGIKDGAKMVFTAIQQMIDTNQAASLLHAV